VPLSLAGDIALWALLALPRRLARQFVPRCDSDRRGGHVPELL
jgi:hypothetical protein